MLSCQIDPDSGCHIWREGTDKDGYPKLYINGKHWRGNRAVLYATTGTTGPMALHSCHQPLCLNPDHLRWGTAKDNTADMWRSHRAAMNLRALRGSSNGRSKLTEIERADIVRCRHAGESVASVMAKYRISRSTVAAVLRAAGASLPTGRPRATKELS